MMRRLSGWILKSFGWDLVRCLPDDMKKFVLIVAPHTSNWDFVWGRLAFNVLDLPTKFLIKKEAFFWPMGGFLKKMGGIPVDRKKSNNIINEVAHLFAHHDELVVTLTPEGTRKLSKNWKRGFYHIAIMAKVPIAVAFLDYGRKECGIAFTFTPTGDYDKDFEPIRKLYMDKTAKFPDNFSLSPQYHKSS